MTKVRKANRHQPPVILRGVEEMRAYKGSASVVYLRGYGKYVRDTTSLSETDTGALIRYSTETDDLDE